MNPAAGRFLRGQQANAQTVRRRPCNGVCLGRHTRLPRGEFWLSILVSKAPVSAVAMGMLFHYLSRLKYSQKIRVRGHLLHTYVTLEDGKIVSA